MIVTDEQLRRLVASDPSDTEARAELRRRVLNAVQDELRQLPPRTGTLDGEAVYLAGQPGPLARELWYPVAAAAGRPRPLWRAQVARIVRAPLSPRAAWLHRLAGSLTSPPQ